MTLDERAARAMGFVEKSWGNAGVHWHDPATDRPMAGWHPSTCYDEAMMLRDRCKESGLRLDFAKMLLVLTEAGDTLFASAEQITQAAVEVLESKGGSNGD